MFRDRIRINVILIGIWVGICGIKFVELIYFWNSIDSIGKILIIGDIFISSIIGFNSIENVSKENGHGLCGIIILILIMIKNTFNDFIGYQIIYGNDMIYISCLFVKNVLRLISIYYIAKLVGCQIEIICLNFHKTRDDIIKNYCGILITVVYTLIVINAQIYGRMNIIYIYAYNVLYILVVMIMCCINTYHWKKNNKNDEEIYSEFAFLSV